MATKMSYAEQLKHPNWQRKRLEVLGRADFKCEECGDANTTLHVHHKQYVKGRLAWEYGAAELRALCEVCHGKGHSRQEALARLMGLTFAADVSVEQFAFGFLTGLLSTFGQVNKLDIQFALDDEPRFFGMGVMLAALGPTDVVAAVRRKQSEGRLPPSDPLLDYILKNEEEGQEGE